MRSITVTHFENPDTGDLYDGSEVRINPEVEEDWFGVHRYPSAYVDGLPKDNHVHAYTDDGRVLCFPNIVKGRATKGTCTHVPVPDADPFWMAQWHRPPQPTPA